MSCSGRALLPPHTHKAVPYTLSTCSGLASAMLALVSALPPDSVVFLWCSHSLSSNSDFVCVPCIQVAPRVADDAASQQQQQLVACGACWFQFDPAAAVANNVGNLVVKLQPNPMLVAMLDADPAADPTEARPVCSTCLAATMLGQLVVDTNAAQQPAQQEQQ